MSTVSFNEPSTSFTSPAIQALQLNNKGSPLKERVCCNWQSSFLLFNLIMIIAGVVSTYFMGFPIATLGLTALGVCEVVIYHFSNKRSGNIPVVVGCKTTEQEYKKILQENSKYKKQFELIGMMDKAVEGRAQKAKEISIKTKEAGENLTKVTSQKEALDKNVNELTGILNEKAKEKINLDNMVKDLRLEVEKQKIFLMGKQEEINLAEDKINQLSKQINHLKQEKNNITSN